jgi:putative flavoprotein involved in K+ transport
VASALGAVVVGAGQAGLAASYYLTQAGIEHVVLERGRIGETWRSQRWDTFVLNTPGWMSHVRAADHTGDRVDRLEAHAARHRAPLRLASNVTRIEPLSPLDEGFLVSVDGPDGPDTLRSRAVVVASGLQNVPRLPAIAAAFPVDLHQVTAADYRGPAQLPSDAVLVVGSAQSGVQVAEDLLAGGRTVYLCTSRVGRLRRRYRGRDMIGHLFDAGFYDVTPEQLPDPAMRLWPIPLTSGVGPLGHSISLQGLAAQGVRLLGRPMAVQGDEVVLDDTVGANIGFGDRISGELKALVDDHLRGIGATLPPLESDPTDDPHPDPAAVHSPAALDLEAAGIGSVVWTCGFGGDFGYLPAEALDARGVPRHDRGVSPIPGLVFVGFPWLTTRKSGIIPGVDKDAARVVDHLTRA